MSEKITKIKPKIRSKRSVAWTYFQEFDTRYKQAKCELCGVVVIYSGNSTNLVQHLRRHHINEYNTLINDSDCRTQQLLNAFVHKTPTNIKYPCNSEIAKKITKQIAVMIAKDLQPFSFVEDSGFIHLMETVEPRYTIPTRKKIREVVTTLYTEEHRKLQQELSDQDSIHLTTDLWTDTKNFLSYIGLTCHYLNKNMELKSKNLATKYFDTNHTAVHIKEAIETCLHDYSILGSIASVTTDNGANVIAAIKEGGWQQFSCYAHTLNLVVTDSLKETSSLDEFFKKCRSIVHVFKSSSTAASALREEQKQKGCLPRTIKKEVPTRWNSTLIMLESIYNVKEFLYQVIPKLNFNRAGTTQIPMLLASDVELLENLIKVLRSFDTVTKELSSEKFVSVSKVIPLTKCLINQLIEHLNEITLLEVRQLARNLKKHCENRFLPMCNSNRYKIATFLDPRFKGVVLDNLQSLREFIKRETEKISVEQALAVMEGEDNEDNPNISMASTITIYTDNSTPSTSFLCDTNTTEAQNANLWMYFDKKKEEFGEKGIENNILVEIKRYEDQSIISRNECPLQWWATEGKKFPNLNRLARQYLARPATSVPSERVFSRSGEILQSKRTLLKPEIVNQLVFLGFNM